MRGCREPASFPVFSLDGEDFFRCPLRVVTPETWQYLNLYVHYRNGFLPVAGGVLDQSARFLAAMAVISAERAEEERLEWLSKSWR